MLIVAEGWQTKHTHTQHGQRMRLPPTKFQNGCIALCIYQNIHYDKYTHKIHTGFLLSFIYILIYYFACSSLAFYTHTALVSVRVFHRRGRSVDSELCYCHCCDWWWDIFSSVCFFSSVVLSSSFVIFQNSRFYALAHSFYSEYECVDICVFVFLFILLLLIRFELVLLFTAKANFFPYMMNFV